MRIAVDSAGINTFQPHSDHAPGFEHFGTFAALSWSNKWPRPMNWVASFNRCVAGQSRRKSSAWFGCRRGWVE